MPSVRRSRESQIGQSLGQRALSSSRTDRAFLWSGKSKPAPKMGHRREKVGVSALWALVSPQLAEIWSAIRFDLAPGYTASPPRSVRPRTQQTASARCRRRSPRTCQVRCRREPGARHCSVVEILGWINPPGSLPQAGRNREEDRHEWRKGRARRLGPDPDEFGQYETGPAPPAHQPSRYIGASNAPSNDRLAR